MDKTALGEAIAQHIAATLREQTREQLYEQAQELEIDGRSQMNKGELVEAIQAQRCP